MDFNKSKWSNGMYNIARSVTLHVTMDWLVKRENDTIHAEISLTMFFIEITHLATPQRLDRASVDLLRMLRQFLLPLWYSVVGEQLPGYCHLLEGGPDKTIMGHIVMRSHCSPSSSYLLNYKYTEVHK